MKKEPLFDLIQSMTMSEKRFFNIFSQRHIIGETNQYLQLFDFIDQQEDIQNELLAKQAFVKNLSAEKNYLYRLILKSLNVYYNEFSTKMKVQNLIISSEILAYKGLEEQALKMLEKAEKMTREAELFSHLLTIHQTQFEILSKLNQYEGALAILNAQHEVIKNMVDLSDIQHKATALYEMRQSQASIRSPEEYQNFEQQVNQHLKKESGTIKTQLFSLSLSVTQAHTLKDFKTELSHLKKIIHLYESHLFLSEYSVKGYLSSLYNLANTYRNLAQYDNALTILDQLDVKKKDKLVSSSKSLSAYLFYLSNSLRLYIFIIKQENDQAYAHYLLLKKEYHLYEGNTDQSVVYEHLMLAIRVNMEVKNYKEALKHSNTIINDTSYKKRADLLTYVRLLNLVIHFELENDFSLDYLSASTMNYLKRKQRLYKTEKELINFITKYDAKNKERLIKINHTLIALKKDPLEKTMFTFFDFQQWVEDKLHLI